jgi:hypothetical protein
MTEARVKYNRSPGITPDILKQPGSGKCQQKITLSVPASFVPKLGFEISAVEYIEGGKVYAQP